MAIDQDPLIDWERRADGERHQLRQGTHFTRDPRQVRKAANMWALRHGLQCRTEIDRDDPGKAVITVQFGPRREKV